MFAPSESLLLKTSLALFLSTSISWLVFARYSMARIEDHLRAEGKNPAPWDGVGIRTMLYAQAILFRGRFNQAISYLIDVPGAQLYAKKSDRIWAAVLFFSQTGLMVVCVLFYWLYGPS